ncbi:MAG: transcription antitermination factor NusB, partial [Patescibacteria group bacterium]
MKTANDPRHQKRITRMQQLFSYSFRQTRPHAETAPIIDELTGIDRFIEKAAPEWPLAKIAKIDLAILRLAVWELMFECTAPKKVAIDEAVELAKSFGNEHSAKFIN